VRAFRLLAMLVCSSALAAAQSPRDGLVVSTTWLAQHLNDRNLVVLHVGPEFSKGHIADAREVDPNAISVSDHSGKGLMLEMPTAEKLHQALADLGISNDSKIVVYFSRDLFTPATRVILTLDHAGFGKNTVLLDGGLNAWTRDGNKTSTDASPTTKGTLAALTIKPIIVDAENVRRHIGEPARELAIGRAHAAVLSLHLIEGGNHSRPPLIAT